jgi:hypothetical protein
MLINKRKVDHNGEEKVKLEEDFEVVAKIVVAIEGKFNAANVDNKVTYCIKLHGEMEHTKMNLKHI